MRHALRSAARLAGAVLVAWISGAGIQASAAERVSIDLRARAGGAVSGATVCVQVVPGTVPPGPASAMAANINRIRTETGDNGVAYIYIPTPNNGAGYNASDRFWGTIHLFAIKDDWCPEMYEIEFVDGHPELAGFTRHWSSPEILHCPRGIDDTGTDIEEPVRIMAVDGEMTPIGDGYVKVTRGWGIECPPVDQFIERPSDIDPRMRLDEQVPTMPLDPGTVDPRRLPDDPRVDPRRR